MNGAERGKLNIGLASPPVGAPHRGRERHLVARSRLLQGVKASGGRALTRWPPRGALCGEREGEGEGGFPRPAAAHASCSLSHLQDGSPGRPRRALKPGPGLDPRLPGRPSPCQPGTHHVSQAAKLFQPEEQPLDGLLHLLRLKRDNILEISKWFPGRQTPFIFFFFFF